jgi:ribonuclease HII
MPTSRHERAFRRAGYRAVAGLDEAGRGALFGLDDSKQLAPERREVLAQRIRERALSWAVAAADAFEIDHVNILQAARLAMRRAVEKLPAPCDCLLVDAASVDLDLPQKALIHGDALSFSIAAASILAKVARDQALEAWDAVFPEYGFKDNKGYGTPEHLAALERLGPTTMHRFSFEPVRNGIHCQSHYRARYQAWTGYPVLQPIPQSISKQGELFACP